MYRGGAFEGECIICRSGIARSREIRCRAHPCWSSRPQYKRMGRGDGVNGNKRYLAFTKTLYQRSMVQQHGRMWGMEPFIPEHILRRAGEECVEVEGGTPSLIGTTVPFQPGRRAWSDGQRHRIGHVWWRRGRGHGGL